MTGRCLRPLPISQTEYYPLGRDRYAKVLAEHQQLMRAVQGHAGHEVDTQGDVFLVVFAQASQAFAGAVEAQCVLDEIPKTGVGKFDKKVLRARFNAPIAVGR